MKKFYIFLVLICMSLSVALSTDAFTMTTTLNYSKPGGVKSDSRPAIQIGETWNLEISIDANGRVKITRLWTGLRNFFLGQQEAIIMEINTDIGPDELGITSEKNMVSYLFNGEKPYFDEDSNSWWYVFCISPKQKNQQISFQFVPKTGDTIRKLSIQYFYASNADDSFFVKNTEYSNLTYKTGFGIEGKFDGEKTYYFKPLTYSDVLFTFDVK